MNEYPGWDVRKIYDAPNPDHMEALGFFAAFANFHDINGHRIECILTKPKHQKSPVNIFSNEPSTVITSVRAVLIVNLSDMSGMRQGESLKVDGQIYTISAISYPLQDIARMELTGAAG